MRRAVGTPLWTQVAPIGGTLSQPVGSGAACVRGSPAVHSRTGDGVATTSRERTMTGVQLVVLLGRLDGSPDESRGDVVIDAPAGTPFAAVREALGDLVRERHGRRGGPGLRFTVAGREVRDDDALGSPPLLRGVVLVPCSPAGSTVGTLPAHRDGAGGRPSDGWAASSGGAGATRGGVGAGGPAVTLVVPRGPGAGSRWVLGGGHHALGRGRGAAVALEDPEVSRVHAVLRVRGSGVVVRDAGSANGTRCRDRDAGAVEEVTGTWRALGAEGSLLVGSSVLRLETPGAEGTTTATGDGHLLVDPPPRARAHRSDVVLDLPAAPVAPSPPRTPVAAVVVPLVLAVVMALVWSPMALLFGLAAPLVVVATSWGERRAQRRAHAGALVEHARRCSLVRERCALALADDLAALRAGGPDPGTLAGQAARRGPALFSGHGPLLLRLGTGEVVSGAALREDGVTTRQVHPDAPVLLDLAEVGVLGVVGEAGAVPAAVAAAVLGAAVLRSPHDLLVAVLAGPRGADGTAGDAPPRRWGWVRWLPHALVEAPRSAPAAEGDGGDGTLAALLALVRSRHADDGGPRGRPDRPEHRPRVLVVVEDAASARHADGVAELLARGPEVGVHALCVGADAACLPAECGAVLTLTGVGATTGRLVVHAGAPGAVVPGGDLLPDLVPEAAAHEMARSLAPLRDATPRGSGGALPGSVRLVEVLAGAGLDATDPTALRALWSRSPRCSRAVLGVHDVGGRLSPWSVDLVGDGPHALVAGTTGAGKSELLATLVTSLAVVNAPEELAFVLVDYKGGAAFADLVGLPHVVGLVTDLDAHLSGRALASLGAEVRRRERALAASGCRDHAEAVARRSAGDPCVPVLPRLVVVVDEFRVLAEELPDFLGGLVRLAAVGRSLGIHLVLATQRPAGVVSADIRANTALRVALRVQDAGDSTDVVDDVGAAALTFPGRALVRSGPSALGTVQVARVAVAPPPPTGPVRAVVREAGRPEAARPPVVPAPSDVTLAADRPDGTTGPTRPGAAPTDVVAVVAAVRAAAAGLPLPRSPWLAPLPAVVDLGAAPPGDEDCGGGGAGAGDGDGDGDRDGAGTRTGTSAAGAALTVGVVDVPDQQRRAPLLLDPRGGALMVVGAPRTGRSTALRAVLAAAAGAGDLHVHVVAAPSPALAGAQALGCVGAHVEPDDHERLLRLLRRLEALVLSRRRSTVAAGTTTLLLLDDAERLLLPSAATHHEDVADLVHRLLTDGPAVGVVPVLAGDRRLLTGRWAAAVTTRWLLAAADPTDHVMAGVPARSVPRAMPPGRVLLERDGGWVLGQVGLLDGPLTACQTAGTSRVGPAPEVPALPRHLTLVGLGARSGGNGTGPAGGPPAPGDVPLGAGGSEAGVVSLDLSGGSCWLVVGAPGSGRSTTLVTLAASARRAGRTVVALARPRSPLARWAVAAGVPCPGAGDAAAVGRALHEAAPAAGGATGHGGDGTGAVLVVVDEVAHVAGRHGEDVLLAALEGSLPVAVVAAGDGEDVLGAFRGLAVALRRSRQAVLLHPVAPGAGEVAGVRLVPPPPGPPGRAVVIASGRTTTVQVACVEDASSPA